MPSRLRFASGSPKAVFGDIGGYALISWPVLPGGIVGTALGAFISGMAKEL